MAQGRFEMKRGSMTLQDGSRFAIAASSATSKAASSATLKFDSSVILKAAFSAVLKAASSAIQGAVTYERNLLLVPKKSHVTNSCQTQQTMHPHLNGNDAFSAIPPLTGLGALTNLTELECPVIAKVEKTCSGLRKCIPLAVTTLTESKRDEMREKKFVINRLNDGSKTATLPMAAEYHERLSEIAKDAKEIKELIQQKVDEIEKDQENNPDSGNQKVPHGCDPIEADDAMKDFINLGANEAHKEKNVSDMILELNADQKRIFDSVTNAINSGEILRLYVSGEGGTGKSFLIKTITCWLRQVKNKDSAVTAPTGIAAFNIDGLTLHRLLQLPVEHNRTPKYRELSDAALKVIRDNFKNVDLIIIDEISMVSNITLMYIHLRLTEIFDTTDVENGWFGKTNIIVFGDLLQLPPVREEPVFIKLSKEKVEKLIGSLSSIDLWGSLFKYDELTINMRQKNDVSYREMLSKIRLGCIDTESMQMLESRKIEITSSNIPDRIKELCDYISTLQTDIVCLMPTNRMCDVLNEAMLDRIPSKEIHLVAEDLIDKPSFKNRVTKILHRWEDDISQTAGLARVISIKIGSKVMLRRNIDVTIGLVNGTIGEVVSVSESLDGSTIKGVTIKLTNGMQYDIERVSVKFEVIDGVYVTRRQFPLCVSYAISFHKSQGLSLKYVVMDCANTIFSCGQIYVGLSRVTSLEGLHLINFDPYSIRANSMCISEYNRLRKLYRPDLDSIQIPNTRGPKTHDVVWAVPKGLTDVQMQDNVTCDRQENIFTGFLNVDGISCYANAVIQCSLFDIFSSIKHKSVGVLGTSIWKKAPGFIFGWVSHILQRGSTPVELATNLQARKCGLGLLGIPRKKKRA
ncbi:ATP-dependent DNA helicase PIF7-like [Venturia canescens]|uniref:ATP-dependent DNA helicase PIF7-like n=1 Tax=Venturia canescens TaxID=32260 RepID=UPI001C9D164E|nr:ATP-dependent DNA helicase PIF7-like [Venturia canescens]